MILSEKQSRRMRQRINKYRRSKIAGSVVLAILTAAVWAGCFYILDKQIQPETGWDAWGYEVEGGAVSE